MKKIFNIIIVAAMGLSLAACTTVIPGMATRNSIGTKVGTAERTVFLGLAFGHTDLGIEKAAKNGGITKVATVDRSITGGLFSKTYKTIVTGE
jgi:hypothetical protein